MARARRRALAGGADARRPRGLHDPARRGQRGALRLAQPRRPHRRRRGRGGREPPAARGERWESSPPGSRSGSRSTAPRSPSTRRRRTRARSPCPAARCPRSTATSSPIPALVPLVFVADCLPDRPPRPGRPGAAPLRLAAAGGRDHRQRRGDSGRDRSRDRARDRSLLLRGRRRGAGRLRAARRRDRRGPHARPRRGRPPAPARGRGEEGRDGRPLHPCNRELFFSHRRDGGATGRQAGLAWLNPVEFKTGEMSLPGAA